MSAIWNLTGSVAIGPASGSPSGVFAGGIPISEAVAIDHGRGNLQYDLVADTPQTVSLDGRNVIAILVKASAKIVTRISTLSGLVTQSIPGTFFVLRTEDDPITAVDVTRQPGVETIVDITIGVQPS